MRTLYPAMAAVSQTSVLVQQFGAFWKLPPREWLALCRLGAAGTGYSLPEDRELQSKPRYVRKNRSGRGYWCGDASVRYVEPLDWSRDDYAEEIRALDRMGVR